jgi:hypothetical protein
MPGRRRPRRRRGSEGACRHRRGGSRAQPRRGHRGLRHRRTPHRAEADPAAGPGPRGQRPVARGHLRFRWLHVTAFVSPATGESFRYLGTGVDRSSFEDTLRLFAREAGAGRDRIIRLVLDGAGWQTAPLAVPDGIRLVDLPPFSPELQPAETLSTHLDEPIANRHFDTIEDLYAVLASALHHPRQQPRSHRKPDRLPLVAQTQHPDPIIRKGYQIGGGTPAPPFPVCATERGPEMPARAQGTCRAARSCACGA